MTERALADLTDVELRALEERLYDDEVAGDDVWFEHDQVLWEMNRRGLCSSHPAEAE